MQEGREDSDAGYGRPSQGCKPSLAPSLETQCIREKARQSGYFKIGWQSYINPPGKFRALAIIK